MTFSSADSHRVRLIDSAEGQGRTTATLLASLAARLTVLHLVSGADVIGSLTAGFAALGREVGKSAEGASLRRAIEAGRAGGNGNALWTKLLIGEWASTKPPSPILDQLRNDFALLLADDLQVTLELMPIPGQMAGAAGTEVTEDVTFVDTVLGLWAFSSEMVRAVELLAAPTLAAADAAGRVEPSPDPQAEPENVLLR